MVIAILAALGGLLLVGIVGLSLSNRGWSIYTVVAAMLVLLSAAGYIYLAARLAERERAWTSRVAALENDLAKVRDARQRVRGAEFEPIPNEPSLAALRQQREDWLRIRAAVANWREPYWGKGGMDGGSEASFELEADGPGVRARITIKSPPRSAPAPADPAAGPAEAAPAAGAGPPPLLAPGALVFVFDDRPLSEGGRFLGSYTVRESAFDPGIESQVLKVVLVGDPTEAERGMLAEPHASVTVYDRLPVDRWVAFSKVRPPTDAGAAATMVRRADLRADFDGVADPQVRAAIDRFLERFAEHDEELTEDEAKAAEERLEARTDLPGSYWARVRFKAAHSFPGLEGRPPREFAPGDTLELDLETAAGLRDAGAAEILRVVRRRPLEDGTTALLGAQAVPGDGQAGAATADGAVALLRMLKTEIVDVVAAGQRLEAAIRATESNIETEKTVAAELESDLTQWRRDAEAATALADAFAAGVETATRERQETEAAVVALGRELTVTMSRLAAEIDRVAPPPAR